jgi:hypothetical protein
MSAYAYQEGCFVSQARSLGSRLAATFYTVMPEYRPLIEARRGDANRLGFALNPALLHIQALDYDMTRWCPTFWSDI